MFLSSATATVPFDGDTLALYEELTGGRENTQLFESRDSCGKEGIKSILFLQSSLRVEGRGETVSFHALSENGQAALEALGPRLENLGDTHATPDHVLVRFPPQRASGTDIERIKAGSPLDAIRLISQSWWRLDGVDEPLRTPGIFSYDLVEQHEDLPDALADRCGLPDFIFWLPAHLVVVDHAAQQATIVAHGYNKRASQANIPALQDAVSHLESQLNDFVKIDASQSAQRLVNTDAIVTEASDDRVEVDIDDDKYCSLVETLKEHIRSGDVFQIVPSRSFSTPCPDPLAAFDALRRLNPSPYMFFLNWDRFTLLGSSPEACVRVTGTPRRVELHPIAGTRPRGKTPTGEIDVELDSRYEAELKLNEKELAEHMMLVDLARNDVARVSKPGTRRVVKLTEVERYSHVMHLVSVVEGELREDLDALHAYVASMNMGTLVGAPKIEAARLLRKHEADRRGAYGGAVAYLTSTGELDSAIIIRSALVYDGVAHVRAGAGVVYDSDPASEAEETRNKAGAVLQAIQRAKGAGR